MSTTKIEWTEKTWNPVTGCTRVSAGCDNCYAVNQTRRLAAMGQEKYKGLINKRKKHFNGVVKTHHPALLLPLKTKKPTRYFVNSMSDLFHDAIADRFIDKVFAVMAQCPQHTFQILTKRAERMHDYFRRWPNGMGRGHHIALHIGDGKGSTVELPLKNVWLGTSIEEQGTANKRVPLLLKTPAAVRFLSAEPLLGPIDLRECHLTDVRVERQVDWVIVGGESGPGARPMVLGWAKDIVRQCKSKSVAVFVKQLGAKPTNREGERCPHIKHKKGADMSEWPEELRVREYPHQKGY